MIKLYSLLLTFIVTTLSVFAQPPAQMSYQAVIRDSEGKLVVNAGAVMRISILQGSAEGTAVYTETRTPVTNANGLVTFTIGGNGTNSVTGVFSAIDWSDGPYFIKTETDPSGGTGYTITGTSQLLTVPYAFHAKTAETISVPIVESDPLFADWDRSAGIMITESQVSDLQTYYLSTNPDGFITAYIVTEEDVTAHESALSITESQITDLQSYLTSITGQSFGELADVDLTGIEAGKVLKYDAVAQKWIVSDDLGLTEETDPVFLAWDKDYTDLTNRPTAISDFTMNANSKKITNVANPVNDQDVATKAYVDALLARIETLELVNSGFTDTRDGNHYNVVKIGNQIWMANNLKYLPSVVGPGTDSQSTSYYYVYDYDGTDVIAAKATSNYGTYGVLYNWTAAMNSSASSSSNPSGVQGVCPTGWHLPSGAEWTELTDYLCGESIAGGKLKETGTTHWSSPNTGATNETGFSALPGGYLHGAFADIGNFGMWWHASEGNLFFAGYRFVGYEFSEVRKATYSKALGFSVRCLRD
ncbi:MAG: fibrobacter succinogenes major paralogous domain-containing protein [Bacteroidales bacterium]